MTRTDSLVVGTLVVTARGPRGSRRCPRRSLPAASTTAAPSRRRARSRARSYREGVLGRPVSVSPLSARTQADRDLVALVFSGLVRNGPAGTLVPDLAERWSVDASGRGLDVPAARRRALARRRAGHREDVAFTIRVLQDPGLPRAGRRLVERGHASRPTATADGRRSRSRRRSAGSSRRRPSRSPRRTCSGRHPGRRAAGSSVRVASRSGPGRSPSPA